MTSKPFIKDPDATLDYEWDWSRWLDGDTILSTVVFAQGGLTVDLSTHTDTSVVGWFSGGQEGLQYWATCRITTVAGRTDDRTIQILVRSR